ncbi:molybdopterin-synthase adenylyltransferase MoeB [Prochlorococcus sp. MIT 1307]|uniref:molybdopterin-synthase adenylyltransferase MoeB n=1 Tax=Prochlorococcus sp. MIT 1307 TaxID=3096219 RepID=UPI002A755B42|nr:molybdopterin-synthase adenylyltransferase MoeB [Prochlorococcus sp. MIT 1307]
MQDHEARGIELSQEEIARYARHLTLPEIGLTGQKRLKASSVLCIGGGGLGSAVLLYLAAAGVGQIGIVDPDCVEDSNLQRQVLHGVSWLGKPKTASAKERILEINPNCKVKTFQTLLTSKNALDIIPKFDIVCDCTDNFPSRYLINDACVLLKKPNIYGSIAHFEGQVTVFNLNKQSPNYRDLMPDPPPPGMLPSCAEGGVLGVLPGLIGVIQATEVIKILTGIGKPLCGRLLVFNALEMKFRELTLNPSSDQKKIDCLIDYEEFCSLESHAKDSLETFSIKSISVQMLKEEIKNDSESIVLIDVRNPKEYELSSIKGAISVPLPSIKNDQAIELIRNMLSNNQRLYAICKSGSRSIQALIELRRHNIQGINITGGMNAWSADMPKESSNY